MCTLLILFRPNNKWPLIIGGNRDEMLDRSWLPPNKHWGNDIIGGKDEVAGGTWFGINKNVFRSCPLSPQFSVFFWGPHQVVLQISLSTH